MKEFEDDNFKFDKNGRELSKRVENTVGKGEIARYEQFFLFPKCFQKACFQGTSLCGNGFILYHELAIQDSEPFDYCLICLFDTLRCIYVCTFLFLSQMTNFILFQIERACR